MIDWIKTAQGVAAIVAAIVATMVAWWNFGLHTSCSNPELAPIHARIEAPEQFNRDTRLLVLDKACGRADPPGMRWPQVTSGSGNGGLAAVRCRPTIVIAPR